MTKRNGIDLIKQFEGCKLKAYKCPAGIWTIGWGRTTNVREGDTCTQAQADAWLEAEYDQFEAGVIKMVTRPITDDMKGALTSFAYNLGLNALRGSKLLKKLNAGDFQGASDEFPKWVNAGGVRLAGLVKRRAAEQMRFRGVH